MPESNLRLLQVFLRVYAVLSLVLFSGLMLAFAAHVPWLDESAAGHWLIWDRIGDHVAPMLFAVYIVWSIFLYRAAREPLAHTMFLDFTMWANVAHAISMVPHALESPEYHIKFLTDIPWVLLPVVAITLLRPTQHAAAASIRATVNPSRRQA